MLNNQQNIKSYSPEITLLVVLYMTLLVSFLLGENSTGGAVIDFSTHSLIIDKFESNFKQTFFNYDQFSTRHSPVLFIFLSLLKKVNIHTDQIRLIYLHINLLLPLIFYNCLKIKFKSIDNRLLILLTSLIFFSPTFRTLAVWPDTRLLGLTIFVLSIYYYLKFTENKKFKYILMNIFLCALSSYISPNFSVFSLFFFVKFINQFGLFSKKILSIIILNCTFAFPAFYYVFILDINFFNKSAAILRDSNNIFFVNIFNDFLITISMILFYLLPFMITKIIKLNKELNFKDVFVGIIFFIISFYFFDYDINNTGGGIFLKLSFFLFDNLIIFYFISVFSIFIFTNSIFKNKNNFFLFLLILLSNPQYTIYHKYFDPFLMIAFFLLFKFKIDLSKFSKTKNILLVFFYFFSFLIISNFKYLWL